LIAQVRVPTQADFVATSRLSPFRPFLRQLLGTRPTLTMRKPVLMQGQLVHVPADSRAVSIYHGFSGHRGLRPRLALVRPRRLEIRTRLPRRLALCDPESFAGPSAAVTILSGSDSQREWTMHVRENHRLFAKLHGYRYEYAHMPWWKNASGGKEPQWLKVRALLARLQCTNSEFLLWVDDDIVFTTKADFISTMRTDMHDKSLLIANDIRLDQVNTGIMLFRSGQESVGILEKMWAMSDTSLGYCLDQSCFHEQEALNTLIKHGEVVAHVVNPVNELYNLNTMWRASHYDEARKTIIKTRRGQEIATTEQRMYLNYDEKDPPEQRWRWGMNMAHVSGMTPSCRAPMLKWIAEYTKRFVFGLGMLNASLAGPVTISCKVHLTQKGLTRLSALPDGQESPHHFFGTPQMTHLDLEVNYTSRCDAQLISLHDRQKFTARLTAQLIVKDEGEYEFFTLSSNGSRLSIDGAQIADNNGVPSMRLHSGKASLSIGHHNISLEFSEQRDGDAGVMFSFRGPSKESQLIILPSFASEHSNAWNITNSFSPFGPFGNPTCPKQGILSVPDIDHTLQLPSEGGPSLLSAAVSLILFFIVLSGKSNLAGYPGKCQALMKDEQVRVAMPTSPSAASAPADVVSVAEGVSAPAEVVQCELVQTSKKVAKYVAKYTHRLDGLSAAENASAPAEVVSVAEAASTPVEVVSVAEVPELEEASPWWTGMLTEACATLPISQVLPENPAEEQDDAPSQEEDLVTAPFTEDLKEIDAQACVTSPTPSILPEETACKSGEKPRSRASTASTVCPEEEQDEPPLQTASPVETGEVDLATAALVEELEACSSSSCAFSPAPPVMEQDDLVAQSASVVVSGDDDIATDPSTEDVEECDPHARVTSPPPILTDTSSVEQDEPASEPASEAVSEDVEECPSQTYSDSPTSPLLADSFMEQDSWTYIDDSWNDDSWTLAEEQQALHYGADLDEL